MVILDVTETLHIIKTDKHDKEEKLKEAIDENQESLMALEKERLYQEVLKEEQEKMKSNQGEFIDKK
ncbi:MAG: hypothetical protein Q7I99_06450 [Acholeplasmataceae bacterium]|nr:hypothetical protein [Acholeplasmataceae bacterium]